MHCNFETIVDIYAVNKISFRDTSVSFTQFPSK